LLYCAHSLNILFGKFFSYYTFFIFYINNMWLIIYDYYFGDMANCYKLWPFLKR
jgi:hypothetical protein